VKLCLDCVSSIGTVPVDLAGVHLASCASGKGLGSYPGLSMVLHQHDVSPSPTLLPRYLDLGYWAADDGIPFTQSSNLVHALEAALLRGDWPARFARLTAASIRLRRALRDAGLRIVADDAHASPAVVSVALPAGVDAGRMGRLLEERGFLLSCNSGYLRRRNWIQVCLMGEWDEASLDRLPRTIAEACATETRAAATV
jgi:aspartate aminotransferase-like enzyme